MRLISLHSVIRSALNGDPSSNVDKPDPTGMSALHWACLRNHEVCARLLLDRGYPNRRII